MPATTPLPHRMYGITPLKVKKKTAGDHGLERGVEGVLCHVKQPLHRGVRRVVIPAVPDVRPSLTVEMTVGSVPVARCRRPELSLTDLMLLHLHARLGQSE